MTRYRYKVVPAPAKGRKAPGVKGAEARFAHGLQEVINEIAADGWEYVRADILPSEERQGLTSTHTVYRTVLVFRQETPADSSDSRAFPPLTAERSAPEKVVGAPELAPEPEEVSAQEEPSEEPQVATDPPNDADVTAEDGDAVEAERDDRRD